MLAHKLGRAPFIPAHVLAKFKVHEKSDNRFQSAARLRQALYREQRGWPMGVCVSANGKKRRIGSCVDQASSKAAAFLTPEIARLVNVESAYREDGSLIDQTRLWCNLLSSAPLVFNVFGILKADLMLATRVMQSLCPGLVHRVTDIVFETSPGRRDSNFLADRTAFDVLIKIVTRQKQHGFIAVEVKYAESMNDQPARTRPRYRELARESGLFVEAENVALFQSPMQQLTRQHLLAYAMVANNLYSTGRFILIAPSLNSSVQSAAGTYRRHLNPDHCLAFDLITLEAVVDAIKRCGGRGWAKLLHERYIDLTPLDDLL